MATRPLTLILAAAVPLAGCAVGPEYRPSAAAELGVPEAYSVPASAQAEDLTRWWTRFDDPLLASLVERFHVQGQTIAFCGLKKQVIDAMERDGLWSRIGKQSSYRTEHQALDALLPTLAAPAG